MLRWLGFKQSSQPSLQDRIIKNLVKNRKFRWETKEIDILIQENGEQILSECNLSLLMQLSAKCENYHLYIFLLKSNPRLVKVKHFKIFLKHRAQHLNPRRKSDECKVPYDLIKLVMKNMRDLEKSKGGRKWIKKLFSVELASEGFIYCLERIFAWEIDRENLETFLTYDYRTIIKSECPGPDVLVSAFSNCDPDVQAFLETVKIDVNARSLSTNGTDLHYAAESGAIKNIQKLLAEGLDPNMYNKYYMSPLEWILDQRYDFRNFETTGDKCIKLLLIGGSDILTYLGTYNPSFGFFKIDKDDLSGGNSELYANVVDLLVAQFAIDKMRGLSVENPIKEYRKLKCHDYDCSFYEKCLKQLEKLKSHKFRESLETSQLKFTIHNIIVESIDKFARYIDGRDRNRIKMFMKEYKRNKSLIPFYYEILEYRMGIIDKTFEFTYDLKSVVADCMGLFDANHLVVNNIVNYLIFEDIAMVQKRVKSEINVEKCLEFLHDS